MGKSSDNIVLWRELLLFHSASSVGRKYYKKFNAVIKLILKPFAYVFFSQRAAHNYV